METTFKPKEAIAFGWQTMKKHFWFFVVILLIMWAAELIPTGIANIFREKVVLLYALFTLAAWFLQIMVRMGAIRISLDILDKGSAEYATLFSQLHLIGKFILGAIVYALIVLGGMLLLIVPGIIWSIKYQFFGYLIIDKNMSPMESIKKSGEITAGKKGTLFLLGLLLLLINVAGALFFGVGLFATIPLSMMATVYVYRKLLGEAPEGKTSAPSPATPLPDSPAQPIA